MPTQFGHRQVLVKAYVHRIVIVSGCEVIAEHHRSYEREVTVYDPLHYLALLEHKSRALDQAAPLVGWQLPECCAPLRRLLEARLLKRAAREYIQVLRPLETFPLAEVTAAVEQALALNTINFDFLAIPALNKTLVLELARSEYRARKENVLLLGNSGTGKTHVALALGLSARPARPLPHRRRPGRRTHRGPR